MPGWGNIHIKSTRCCANGPITRNYLCGKWFAITKTGSPRISIMCCMALRCLSSFILFYFFTCLWQLPSNTWREVVPCPPPRTLPCCQLACLTSFLSNKGGNSKIFLTFSQLFLNWAIILHISSPDKREMQLWPSWSVVLTLQFIHLSSGFLVSHAKHQRNGHIYTHNTCSSYFLAFSVSRGLKASVQI